MSAYTPGPGDIVRPFAGHPLDPQAPEHNGDDATAEVINNAIDDVRSWMTLAEIARSNNDVKKVRDCFYEALMTIEGFVGESQ